MAEGSERKNVYISLHEAFVREGIQYTDRKTGEQRTFNVARLPSDTFIDGRDVGGYEFSPLYVNRRGFRGEHWRDIPLAGGPRGASEPVGARRGGQAGSSARTAGGEGHAHVAPRPDQGRALRGAQALRGGARPGRPGPDGARGGGKGASAEMERGASARPLGHEAR